MIQNVIARLVSYRSLQIVNPFEWSKAKSEIRYSDMHRQLPLLILRLAISFEPKTKALTATTDLHHHNLMNHRSARGQASGQI
jgi:hypothetical protein